MADEIREALAAYSHDSAWGGWMRYMFGKGTMNADGTWTMPAWAVERWTRQMTTTYADLSEEERKSDRAEADEMLAISGTLELLAELEQAAPVVCSMLCPSVWQTGTEQPHSEQCQAVRAAISKARGTV